VSRLIDFSAKCSACHAGAVTNRADLAPVLSYNHSVMDSSSRERVLVYPNELQAPTAGPYVNVLAYTGCCRKPRAPSKREEEGPSGLTEAPTHRRAPTAPPCARRRNVCPLAVLLGLAELGPLPWFSCRSADLDREGQRPLPLVDLGALRR
jgi:hypothetical protein